MRSLHVLALLTLAAASACATATDDVPGLRLGGGDGDKADTFSAAADVTVERAMIDGSMLSLEVTYAGGEASFCVEHDFILDWDETFTDARPPGAVLELVHDPKGDTCTDRVWTVLHFDIAGLADAYAEQLGVDSATVLVTLLAGPSAYGVPYTF